MTIVLSRSSSVQVHEWLRRSTDRTVVFILPFVSVFTVWCLAVTKTASIEFARRRDPIVSILLHPGTVDTDLSKPFQRNVPQGKLFTKEYSVERLLGIIDGVDAKDNGKFFAWDGQEIVWWVVEIRGGFPTSLVQLFLRATRFFLGFSFKAQYEWMIA